MCECGHVFSALLTALYVLSGVVKVVSVACEEDSIFACKLSAVASLHDVYHGSALESGRSLVAML